MSIDSTDIAALETKIDSALAADPATTIRDATGNEIQYQRPPLNQLSAFYDWLKSRTSRTARRSMFDKFRFVSKT
jgi:hypothetical protein